MSVANVAAMAIGLMLLSAAIGVSSQVPPHKRFWRRLLGGLVVVAALVAIPMEQSPIFLVPAVIVAALVARNLSRDDRAGFGWSRGYFLLMLAVTTAVAWSSFAWPTPVAILLLTGLAAFAIMPSLLILWKPGSLRWGLPLLVAATLTGWVLLILLGLRKADELGPEEYVPFADWLSLWFLAAGALAPLALVVRATRWLGRALIRGRRMRASELSMRHES
jgi:hypothetical protein